ncbi:acyclic terpene utilization AtuA family protein [Phenylobacterium sp. Root700]|uniref:acyclic terpene utilization AtuA family protein n=1 Tax=Phenylobacterium sp. Root700 TaxID=1736591 RepID=UPI0006F76674|nr:acyclic terpene utilization AtuA family protein [Phenylobacterium sp. Root700]KRB44346.1 terpene utilization protein AtuA [Phenylobacterium sp. Root700]
MVKIVRIGGAGGFLGDSSVAAPQLLKGGRLDYMILDYLAEATMSSLGQLKAARPDQGYARDFTEWVWKDNLQELKAQGVKIVTNAGGLNPHACRARMEELAAAAGLSFKIAVVEGDDLMGRLDDLAARGLTEMFTDAAFPDPKRVFTANAYFGGRPIAEALAAGADMVITGRVVDSALALGPLMHEFDWTEADHDLLSAGSLAGHVIECGAQATGGLFTDWEDVSDWAHIGYPVIECQADGTFVVTKPPGTGGLVSPAAVAEQILYEVGDPQGYALPDVVCDFTQVKVEAVGEDRVRVSGAKGYPPSGAYKVCITFEDGYRFIGAMPVVGRDAVRKAERQAQAVLERLGEMLRDRNLPPLRDQRIELLGAETSYGAQARPEARAAREVVARVGAEHESAQALGLLAREFASPTTSMSVGSTGWFGGAPTITPVARVFSVLLPRVEVDAVVSLGAERREIRAAPPAALFDPGMVVRPVVPEPPSTEGELVLTPLIDLAWARSGDKGDAFNIGVIARRPEYLPWIRRGLRPDAVQAFFAHEFEGAKTPKVLCYELPGLQAINLHCIQALGGGQFSSLRLDPLAKGKAQQLLDMEIEIPAGLLGG